MEKPLLTICLLCHNSEKFLEKTLKSLLGQTYPNFEIVISDNQSTDRTVEIIKYFQKQNPKIIFRRNIPNIELGKLYDGCYDNCNGCLRSGLIKGEFVSFCHSDDIYEKDIAEKEVEFLMNNPDAGAIFTLGNIIDENNKIIGRYRLPKELKGKNAYNFTDIFRAILRHGNTFLITPTFMARKEIFQKIGLFCYEDIFKTSADLEMWLKIAEKYRIGILEEKLINWRTGGGGKKYQQIRTEQADFFKVMDYYLTEKSYLEKMDKKSLRQYLYQKDFDNTLRAMNFLIKNDIISAKKLINKPFSFEIFWAFLENINLLRIKVFILKIIMLIGVNLGLEKYLGKLLSI